MGLLDTLRSFLPVADSPSETSGDEPGAPETFAYRCRDCDREFESPHRHVTDAACPDCGSPDVRVVDPFGDG